MGGQAESRKVVMPGWVLPAVAAELWGVSEDHVLAEVSAGRLRFRREGEFLFVDVAPSIGLPDVAAVVVEETRPAMQYRRSLVWSVPNAILSDDTHGAVPLVTSAERDALLDEMPIAPVMDGADEADEDAPAGDAPEPGALTQDDVPNWEAV